MKTYAQGIEDQSIPIWFTSELRDLTFKVGYLSPILKSQYKTEYGDFNAHIQEAKKRIRKTRKQLQKSKELLTLAYRAVRHIDTDKAHRLKRKIRKRLNQIYAEINRIDHTFKPTQSDIDFIEGWNAYYEFIGPLKLHKNKPLLFEDRSIPEDINTIRKQRNQWVYRYKGSVKARTITKTDKVFKLQDMRKGWKYNVIFRCPICGDEVRRSYSPRKNKGSYKTPDHCCTITVRTSAKREIHTVNKLKRLDFLTLMDKKAQVRRAPHTWKNRYGTHGHGVSILTEMVETRLGHFPTKQITLTEPTQYAITKVTRTKRLRVKVIQ